MVTGISVRSRREDIVSIIQIYRLLIVKLVILKIKNYEVISQSKNARHYLVSSQNLVKFCPIVAEAYSTLWQYLNLKNKNKKQNLLPKKTNLLKKLSRTSQIKKAKNNTMKPNHRPLESMLQSKSIAVHNDDYKLMLSGDVESNPGPLDAWNSTASEIHNDNYKLMLAGDVESNPGPLDSRSSAVGGKTNSTNERNLIEIITYNCRGLRDYKKLKRVLNTCSGVVTKNKLNLVFLQETHLEQDANTRLGMMWRGGFCLSPGAGNSRGCVTLFGHGWEVEEKYESLDGRLACLVIKSESLSLITLNIYAPNDHDI